MNAQLEAIERLAQTRQLLREAMQGGARPTGATQDRQREHTRSSWLANLKAQPLTGLLLNVVRVWWMKQPLGLALTLAGAASQKVLRPTARAHPYRLLFIVAGVGGLIALVRPWRFLSGGFIRAALRAAK